MVLYEVKTVKKGDSIGRGITIEREELTPSKLELFLVRHVSEMIVETQLTFEEKDEIGIPRYRLAQTKLPEGTNEEGAIELLEQYNQKLKEDKYIFHLSDDGRSRIEWR